MASADLFQKLLSRLNSKRDKSRRGSGATSRSYDERKAISDARQRDYGANQNRYRGDFEHLGGTSKQVVTGYYNPETGATWSAPNSGWKPKEGTGWVKGYGPNTNEGKSPGYTQPGSGSDVGLFGPDIVFRPGGGMYDYKKPWMTEEDNEAFLSKFGGGKSNSKDKGPAKPEARTRGRKYEASLRSRMSKF